MAAGCGTCTLGVLPGLPRIPGRPPLTEAARVARPGPTARPGDRPQARTPPDRGRHRLPPSRGWSGLRPAAIPSGCRVRPRCLAASGRRRTQQPAVFGKIRKELLANRDYFDAFERGEKVPEDLSCIDGVSDLCGHHERQAAARLQDAGSRNHEWRPRRTQPGQRHALRGTVFQRPLPQRTVEPLVADEGRVSDRSGKPVIRFGGPSEEVGRDDPRLDSLRSRCGGDRVDIDAHGILQTPEKTAIATRRVENAAGQVPLHRPGDEGTHDVCRSVVRPKIFATRRLTHEGKAVHVLAQAGLGTEKHHRRSIR